MVSAMEDLDIKDAIQENTYKLSSTYPNLYHSPENTESYLYLAYTTEALQQQDQNREAHLEASFKDKAQTEVGSIVMPRPCASL